MTYHFTGAVSAVIFLLTIGGLWDQLRMVWRRRALLDAGELAGRPTAILSLNQFVSSFLAFFSFLVYGACLDRFNHYLVWPRMVAALLTLTVLFEIMRDRRDRASTTAFTVCAAAFVAAPLELFLVPATEKWAQSIFQGVIVVVTFILAQGYVHQVMVIRATGRTGAISARFHWFFLVKDLSSIAFALAMGSNTGWPLMLLSSVSAITKVLTLWHFRWVRSSPVAKARRDLTSAIEPEPLMPPE